MVVHFINDATANALEKSCNGSRIRLLTHLHKKAYTSGDTVGAAAELQLSKMREGGIHDLQVKSLNECVESYSMWNAAQPESKVRARTLVHQDYISVFKKWGATVFNKYEIKRLGEAGISVLASAAPSTSISGGSEVLSQAEPWSRSPQPWRVVLCHRLHHEILPDAWKRAG